MIQPPRNVLCSYHYFKDYDLDKLASLRIIGDSGAFSAKSQGATISTADLARWAKQWRHRLAWVAALDVIGDPEATRRNWHDMVEGHGVPGVPTVHFGESPTELDYYANRGVDFVGLGGMVGKHTTKQMRWLVTMFRYARDHHPTMRFHGWGVTADSVLRLPFYSVDSSGWTAAVRYGRLNLRDPATPKDYTVSLDGRDIYRPEVARLLRRAYGVSMKDASTSSGANRDVITRLAALSTSVQEARFRRLHGPIAAPVWGQLSGDTGSAPHLHMATARIPNADPIIIEDLNREDGPHLHLADGEGAVFERLAGPHLHLATSDNTAFERLAVECRSTPEDTRTPTTPNTREATS